MKESFAKAGVGRLCKLFGKTRHAFYERRWYEQRRYSQEQIVLELLGNLRKEIPVQSTKSIYQVLKPTLRNHGITIGRDALHEIRKAHNLLYKPRKRFCRTTDSFHRFYKYPNLIKDMTITAIEQVWVCDITYIRVGDHFNFLSLITDAYSHLIVGYCLHPTLDTAGPLQALQRALTTLTKPVHQLIHHSDRGTQYCCQEYIAQLTSHHIQSSMTEKGDPYENAVAERVNGILKHNFKLDKVFPQENEAKQAVDRSITAYNEIRPHQSISMLTPTVAHTMEHTLTRTWKTKSSLPRDPPLNNHL